jgi:signal transduction histidine kinase
VRISATAAAPDIDSGAAAPARPSLLPDAALALVLLLFTSLPLMHRHHSVAWWLWLVNALLVLPLAWRRRYPSAVFAGIAAMALVQWSAGEPLLGDVALMIALYTVAAYEDRRHALVAAGVLEVGIFLASLRFSPAGDSVLASIVFLTGLLAGALFLGTTVRTRRAYLESLVDRARRLERERNSQARLAATEERTRIAREMHDIVAHSLSVMISLADGAALTTDSDPATARTAMQAVSGTGRTALAEMRRLLGVLRDEDSSTGELTPQPGLAQLDQLIAAVRTAGLPASFTVTGAPAQLPPTRQTAIYRVVQEALTNVLKHGKGVTTVAVRMTWTSDTLAVDICDDGELSASHIDAAAAGVGHGLTGMRERIALHGGTIVAGPGPGPGRGWRVHALLPLDGQSSEQPGPAEKESR